MQRVASYKERDRIMDDTFGAILMLCILVAAGILLGVTIDHALTDNSWRDQIASHGCARYYLDKNNDRQWDWIQKQ